MVGTIWIGKDERKKGQKERGKNRKRKDRKTDSKSLLTL